jgi:hypothetical protein
MRDQEVSVRGQVADGPANPSPAPPTARPPESRRAAAQGRRRADHRSPRTPSGRPVHRRGPAVPAVSAWAVRAGLRHRGGHRQETQPHPRGRGWVLVVGDRGGPPSDRHKDRGDARAHPLQLRRIHAAHDQRDRADAAGRPVQDRHGEAAADLPGASRGAHRDHLPGPGRERRAAAGVGLRRVRADLERGYAVPVPAPLRLRGPADHPQLHPRMHGRDLTGCSDHRRRSAAGMAPP